MNFNKTICFFDLEETLINEWGEFFIVNEKKVSKFIKTLPNNTEFGLFSFAVYNQKDLDLFNKEHKDFIQNVFGFKFDDNLLFTVEDIISNIKKIKKTLKFDFKDFFDFFDKESSFSLMSKLNEFKNCHLILVDDLVNNIELFNKDLNVKVTFINVFDL